MYGINKEELIKTINEAKAGSDYHDALCAILYCLEEVDEGNVVKITNYPDKEFDELEKIIKKQPVCNNCTARKKCVKHACKSCGAKKAKFCSCKPCDHGIVTSTTDFELCSKCGQAKPKECEPPKSYKCPVGLQAKEKPKCPKCGREMEEVYDEIANKFTGYSWGCQCRPDIIISIG